MTTLEQNPQILWALVTLIVLVVAAVVTLVVAGHEKFTRSALAFATFVGFCVWLLS